MNQVTDWLHLTARTAAYWKRIVAAAVLVAVLLTLAAAFLMRPVYVSEVYALLQPQERSDALAGKLDLDEEIVFSPRPPENFIPRPPDVVDVERIAKSQAVLEMVAARYHEQHPDARSFSVKQLGDLLSVESRLILKTPYHVEYSPVLMFQSRTATEDAARPLLQLWTEALQETLGPATLNQRLEAAFRAVGEEYERRLETLAALDEETAALQREGDPATEARLRRLRLERDVEERVAAQLGASMVNVSAVLARTQRDFTFLTEPSAAVRESTVPPLPLVALGAFIAGLAGFAALQALALLMRDTAAALRQRPGQAPGE
jgi:uncharacterized protein involved in exopolysaccharide biosynthesis